MVYSLQMRALSLKYIRATETKMATSFVSTEFRSSSTIDWYRRIELSNMVVCSIYISIGSISVINGLLSF